jgi:hypothetical protein
VTLLYGLTYSLLLDSRVPGDKGYNSANEAAWLAADGVRLVPIRKRNMKQPHEGADEYDLRTNRRTVGPLNSQSGSMYIQQKREWLLFHSPFLLVDELIRLVAPGLSWDRYLHILGPHAKLGGVAARQHQCKRAFG